MLTVEYPPGAVEHIHRHDAYAFVYVLEGTIVEQVRGGKEVTLNSRADFLRRPRRRAHGRAQRERDQAGKVCRGHGEKEGRRRCFARGVNCAVLKPGCLILAVFVVNTDEKILTIPSKDLTQTSRRQT